MSLNEGLRLAKGKDKVVDSTRFKREATRYSFITRGRGGVLTRNLLGDEGGSRKILNSQRGLRS